MMAKVKRHNKRRLEGARFGSLLVREEAWTPDGFARWLCACDCGAQTTLKTQALVSGNTKSCGCLGRAMRRDGLRKSHGGASGYSKTPTYSSWASAVSRCTNPWAPSFSRYGARGVTVCERWRSFEAFLADMGPRPEGTSLDRIDNDGNYEPGNCRWATRSEQQNNRRCNRVLRCDGRDQTITEWAREMGVSVGCIAGRLSDGWPVDRAIRERPNPKRPKRQVVILHVEDCGED